ncbi:gamma-glutamyltranspeptidase / glutathione hydrolase [Robiginitalea myxolifaciens]|uniref:Glutathione hydrolase proenzyme n=1 Tax=Robiginitalea myxolifaciens TaxID=400055 RepID=A0A1I6HB82_9FLAO|nr:gamma-glutamyltransferase [Robiginitalea myxolifaciens]SFR51756.1 gamma-glutamyltranspeptidase / glutathione hydrolase [Robiginitalea myxolifaciens]
MKSLKRITCLLIYLIGIQAATAQTYARNGMVVSASEIASEVGVDILKKGGNAIDASVATAFALAVTHPTAGNIGGGGFLVFMDASGSATTIDFREKAPMKATADMFLDESGELGKSLNLYGRESTNNHIGLKSVGVPGTVAGLYLAHQKYGKLPWAQLVQPAVDLANNGFKLTWGLSRAAVFFNGNSPIPFLQDYFKNKDGELTSFGEVWKQPELAKTLSIIRDKGHDGFYKGEVADEIARYMKANGGIITKKDLRNYSAIERTPVKGTYKGYEIYSMPPPSSGGVALIEMMNLMELADHSTIEFNSTEYVHLVAEVMRRAFADRAEHLGDPDFNLDTPIAKLTSKEFAKQRFENIDFSRASPSDTTRFGQLYDGTSTTHFSVVDKAGNAVSLTYTLEHGYGSGMGSPKLGFIFNNEMGDFNPIPGITTSTGLIGTNPNLIEPEKRMLSSMTPTIVAKDGKPYLVIGSPGGRTIINTVFQTVFNVLEYNMPIDMAIEAMKIHHQWFPDEIRYERPLLSPDTRKNLEKMGHKLAPRASLGALMGIVIDAENGVLIGAPDSSRPDGAAIGY